MWDESDEFEHIEDSQRNGDFEMTETTVKVTVMQIRTYYVLAHIHDVRIWTTGLYSKESAAKGALTRMVRRAPHHYEAVSFDAYQEAVKAIEK